MRGLASRIIQVADAEPV